MVRWRKYPQSLPGLRERFRSETACYRFLIKLRWPNGFTCPRCGKRHERRRPWFSARLLLICRNTECGYQVSPLAGTALARTRLEMRSWFDAIWWMLAEKQPGTVRGLQSFLGLRNYKTAWRMHHLICTHLCMRRSVGEYSWAGYPESIWSAFCNTLRKLLASIA